MTSRIVKEWLAFSKSGIGGIQVFTNSRKQAMRRARELYGKGATVEFRKKTILMKVM